MDLLIRKEYSYKYEKIPLSKVKSTFILFNIYTTYTYVLFDNRQPFGIILSSTNGTPVPKLSRTGSLISLATITKNRIRSDDARFFAIALIA
jgi:hypothetical protein